MGRWTDKYLPKNKSYEDTLKEKKDNLIKYEQDYIKARNELKDASKEYFSVRNTNIPEVVDECYLDIINSASLKGEDAYREAKDNHLRLRDAYFRLEQKTNNARRKYREADEDYLLTQKNYWKENSDD